MSVWKTIAESGQKFLESSTIHGLAYISISKSVFAKTIWFIFVVIGFLTAGYIIFRNFTSFLQAPIVTSLETLPISDLTFPEVTICPPAHSNTALNYDLEVTAATTLDNKTRDELLTFATNEIFKPYHDAVIEWNRWVTQAEDIRQMFRGTKTVSEVRYFRPKRESSYKLICISRVTGLKGATETPLFGKVYDKDHPFNEKEYFSKIEYFNYTIIVPSGVKNDSVLVVEIEYDTVKQGVDQRAKDEISIVYKGLQPSQKTYYRTGKGKEIIRYKIDQEAENVLLILYKRFIPINSRRRWKNKRETGFRLQWSVSTQINDENVKVETLFLKQNTLFISWINLFGHLKNLLGFSSDKIMETVQSFKNNDIINNQIKCETVTDDYIIEIMNEVKHRYISNDIPMEHSIIDSMKENDWVSAFDMFVIISKSCSPRDYFTFNWEITLNSFYDNLLRKASKWMIIHTSYNMYNLFNQNLETFVKLDLKRETAGRKYLTS